VAVPAAAVTVAVVLQGGLLLAGALALLGAAAARELYRLLGGAGPARTAGLIAVALLPLAALYDGSTAMLAVVVAAMPAAFLLSRGHLDGASSSIADTMLGVVWVGVALAHGVLLRELSDGALLTIAVLVGTFLGDTAAHLVGAAVGRVQIAPRISPGKTLEGLLAGIVMGTASLWIFLAIVDAPVDGLGAVALGLAVAIAAPAGDLFESLFKRDAGQKDSGRAFGAHGGVLDRIDAVLFALVVGYYVARALV
jgi:phosphatidate cytidylyltransferase